MALHTELPIHKVAYDLLDVVTDLVKNMPRDFKQSLGGKLRDESIEILTAIFRANCARENAGASGRAFSDWPDSRCRSERIEHGNDG